jgi:hypothetical protein
MRTRALTCGGQRPRSGCRYPAIDPGASPSATPLAAPIACGLASMGTRPAPGGWAARLDRAEGRRPGSARRWRRSMMWPEPQATPSGVTHAGTQPAVRFRLGALSCDRHPLRGSLAVPVHAPQAPLGPRLACRCLRRHSDRRGAADPLGRRERLRRPDGVQLGRVGSTITAVRRGHLLIDFSNGSRSTISDAWLRHYRLETRAPPIGP